MHKIFALFRAGALQAASYRLSTILSVVGLIGMTIPIYFVADALQPVMAETIESQASNYFAFVLLGIFVFSFLKPATSQLSGIIGGGIATGTLEAMLSTSTRLPTLVAGMMSYSFCWQLLRGLILLLFGAVLGAKLLWGHMLFGMVIVLLTIGAYFAVGMVAAALVLTFRTAGPLNQIVLTLSGLLGGVYYPTQVIPTWIENLSLFIPLTYGLRALRRTVLNGEPISAVRSDLLILVSLTGVLLLAATFLFRLAYDHARRAGTLTHY